MQNLTSGYCARYLSVLTLGSRVPSDYLDMCEIRVSEIKAFISYHFKGNFKFLSTTEIIPHYF